MDPITAPLIFLVLGKFARDLIRDATKDYLKDKLKSLFGRLEKIGERDKVERAYQDVMEQAFEACLEMLLLNIKSSGYTDDELKQYRSSIEAFVKDAGVADQLWNAVRDPGNSDLPSASVFRERWKAVGGRELPSDTLWNTVAVAFRRQATKRVLLADELRDLLNAQNLQQVKELLERQGGVKVQVHRDRYFQRMRTKYSPVDLANLMPSYVEDPGRMVLRDVFVPQQVRENPPPVEIPKDLVERLRKGGYNDVENDDFRDLDAPQLEKLRTAFVSQSPKPVLDVISAPANRLLVLTGEPGSGKSTLMRYLLTGIIDPPVDRHSNEPLAWTRAVENAFPLLIELRDFYALRQSKKCESFLEYVYFMGKTDQWFLDDHAVHEYLENGPSLVMFDGLDEIFDSRERHRVQQEIAGFGQRYPNARILVTTRPVGYREQVLRDAGFAHFGIEDLDDEQIESFVRGWFALTFPQYPQRADQRIGRVLGTLESSSSIRLLAGNPMLLTIMALLAREEELPRERSKFYEKSVEVLCHHWDANRNLELPEDRYLNADDKKALLRRIAMRMHMGEGGMKGNFIHEGDLAQEIQSYLIDEQWQPNAGEARKAARRMIAQLRERNYILCLRGPHLYGFVHRTFFEFLTASEYVRRFDRQPQQISFSDLIELFDQHCTDDYWREVLRLICGQIDEQYVGGIVEHLIAQVDLHKGSWLNPIPEVPLAIDCLNEVRNLAGNFESATKALSDLVVRIHATTDHARNSPDLKSAVGRSTSRWPRLPDWQEATRIICTNEKIDERIASSWVGFIAFVGRDRRRVIELVSHGRHEIRSGALIALAERWPDQETRKLLENVAVQEKNEKVRAAALEALTKKWPDQDTRKMLQERAIQDENGWPRSAALESLAQKWPDEETRKLLEERAIQDENGWPRSAALESLARRWPDEQTRKLLQERALQDENGWPRRAALRSLAVEWPDQQTRQLLEERAVHDNDEWARSDALGVLAEKWPDRQTRQLLEELAGQNKNEWVGADALLLLAEKWPGQETRKLFEEHTCRGEDELLNSIVLSTYSKVWPDDRTRQVLEERAVKDPDQYSRAAALNALAQLWPDNSTRELLENRAVQDTDASPRHTALKALAKNWPDDRTRKLLEERAVQEESDWPRSAAPQALAKNWPDEKTRKLLEKLIVNDQNAPPRRAALRALAENWPDERSQALLTDHASRYPDEDMRVILRGVQLGWLGKARNVS